MINRLVSECLIHQHKQCNVFFCEIRGVISVRSFLLCLPERSAFTRATINAMECLVRLLAMFGNYKDGFRCNKGSLMGYILTYEYIDNEVRHFNFVVYIFTPETQFLD